MLKKTWQERQKNLVYYKDASMVKQNRNTSIQKRKEQNQLNIRASWITPPLFCGHFRICNVPHDKLDFVVFFINTATGWSTMGQTVRSLWNFEPKERANFELSCDVFIARSDCISLCRWRRQENDLISRDRDLCSLLVSVQLHATVRRGAQENNGLSRNTYRKKLKRKHRRQEVTSPQARF